MLKTKIKKILLKAGLLGIIFKLRDSALLAYYVTTGPSYRYLRYSYSCLSFNMKKKQSQPGTKKQTVSLLCPTRGRPKLAERLVKSVCRTAMAPERVEVLFYIDSDDETKDAYMALFKKKEKAFSRLMRCEIIVGEPMSISKSWNILAEKCKGDLLAMTNDDQVYVDYGWDHALDVEAAKFPDKIFCIWFDDGGFDKAYPCFPIVSRRWVEALGYFSLGIFRYGYLDTWIFDIATDIKRLHRIPYVLVEHVHYGYKKAIIDETHRRRLNAEGDRLRDEKLYEEMSGVREEAAEKLRQVISNSKQVNKLLL
ncbi:MAG: hypothetical protein ABH843_05495 [Candidatus Omnitrophota bacterium]